MRKIQRVNLERFHPEKVGSLHGPRQGGYISFA